MNSVLKIIKKKSETEDQKYLERNRTIAKIE